MFLPCCDLVAIGMEEDQCSDRAIEIAEIFHLILTLLWLLPGLGGLFDLIPIPDCIVTVVLKWKIILGGDGKGNWRNSELMHYQLCVTRSYLTKNKQQNKAEQ